MKHFLTIVFCLFLIFSFSCKKENTTDDTNNNISSNENTEKPSYNTTQYVKYQVWLYSNEDDIGKPAKDVKEKTLLEFGNKVTITKDKKIGDKIYYFVTLPDKTTHWIAAENLTEKFITINQPDVICYKQPDTAYINSNTKLQPGDFAYFVKEQDGFINVDFISYMPRLKKNQTTWVGNVWLKDGYTDDLKISRESYILSRAYNDLYGKNPNKENAIQKLKDALEINGGEETEITYVIKTLLNELLGIKVENLDNSIDIQ